MTKQKETEWAATDKQMLVLEAARQSGLQRNISAIAIETGVSRAAIYLWLNNDPEFRKAWENIPKEILGNHMPGIYAALVKKAEMGDVAAIKLALEVYGSYTPPVQRHEHNLSGKLDVSVLTDEDIQGLESTLAKLAARAGATASQAIGGEVQALPN